MAREQATASARRPRGSRWLFLAGEGLFVAGHVRLLMQHGLRSGALLIVLGALLAAWALVRWAHEQATPEPAAAPEPQPQHPEPTTKRLVLLAALVAALTAPVFLWKLDDRAAYHGDESMWMYVSARVFTLAAIDRNPHDPFWRDDFFTWGAYNPPLGKYLIGAGLRAAGEGELPFKQYDFSQNRDWNLAHNRVYSPAITAAGRLPIALSGIACTVLLFVLGALWFSESTGLVAVGLFLTTPYMPLLGRRAQIDAPALCFSLLALVCCVLALRALRRQPPRALLWASAAGLACGLAVGTKLNALLIIGVCGAGIGIEYLWTARQRAASFGVALGCLLLLGQWAWLVFFLTNPYLYAQPLQGVRHMLSLSDIIYTYRYALLTPMRRATAIWNFTSNGTLRQFGAFGLDRLLLLAGLAALIAAFARAPALAMRRSQALLLAWALISYCVITAWLPQNWDRYFLPLTPINSLLQAYGTIWLLTSLGALLRRGGRLRSSDIRD